MRGRGGFHSSPRGAARGNGGGPGRGRGFGSLRGGGSDRGGMSRNDRGGGFGMGSGEGRPRMGEGLSGGGGFGPDRKRPRMEAPENKILLFTIINPLYPITTEVMNKICSRFGEVLRIVVFKKTGVQSMVEFADLEGAKQAKLELEGADIYSNCCTLSIEYAKADRLNVYKNDSETWDYTTDFNDSGFNGSGDRPGGRRTLLGDPSGENMDYDGEYDPRGGRSGPSGYGSGGAGGGESSRYMDEYGPPGGSFGGRGGYGRGRGRGGGMGRMMGEHDDRMGGAGQGTTVIMVYGMNPEKMNCQRLFNLLCMYGNVNKIKFLKTKEGCAMVEVPDSMAAERMMANISGRDAFGSTLSVGFSKQSFIADVRQPYELPDGSESFATYTNSKNNRFTTPELAMKNRIMPPTKHLHFYNVPPGFSEADIKQLFSADEEDGGTKTGYSPEVKLFETKSERTARGILTFNTIEDATECCIMYNHKSIENPGGRFPYTMKLAFTGAGRGGGPRNN